MEEKQRKTEEVSKRGGKRTIPIVKMDKLFTYIKKPKAYIRHPKTSENKGRNNVVV
ncbi:MAG: hypothetical protein LBS34_01075 [Rickettsiales bacterium]|jgi:hypothetical protein|nr:hypothetical protein [Rickettsiales bacterium]